MKKILISSVKVLILMTIITGVVYPLFITFAGQALFPDKAQGSFITENGKTVGSLLIGQKFEGEKYFRSRPSAVGYNPYPSGASNMGPTSKELVKFAADKKNMFIKDNYIKDTVNLPYEMLFSSGSGVDPHISPLAAKLQVERIAKVRKLNNSEKENVYKLIDDLTEGRQLGFLGEARVNVLLLNMKLDRIK